MRTKKNFLLLLCLSLLLSQVGCNQTTENQETSETKQSNTTDETTIDLEYENMSFTERMQYSRMEIDDGLPERDYDGYTFRVQDTHNKRVLRSLDDTGEAVDSAMYNRQIAIEDRFNVKLTQAGIVDTSAWICPFLSSPIWKQSSTTRRSPKTMVSTDSTTRYGMVPGLWIRFPR